MPWFNGHYPPSYNNQQEYLRDKASEIANGILAESGDEGIAIATGFKKAREYFVDHPEEKLRLQQIDVAVGTCFTRSIKVFGFW